MNIKTNFLQSRIILKSYLNKYTIYGLLIALSSIIVASFVVSYQITGEVSLSGFFIAQASNAGIWFLDITPFMFVYLGYTFCKDLVSRSETIINEKTDEFLKTTNALEQKLKYESNHDSVTKLLNSHMFSEQITYSIAQLGNQSQLVIIVIRINDFGNISDNFGTFSASQVLKQFADKLKAILLEPYILQASLGRSSIACLQSTDFALLLPCLKEDLHVGELLSVIHTLLATHYVIDGIPLNISMTSGVAIYPIHGKTEVELLNHAHVAEFHAKKQNKSYLIYSPDMEEDFTQNRMILNELQRSIETHELKIYFQPVVELATGTIVGAEALIHFENSNFCLLNANKIMSLIEGAALSRQLSAFMLTGVVGQLSDWHRMGHRIFISVNLSVEDACDRELPSLVQKLLDDHQIAPQFLKLEFTERACLSDQLITKEVFEQLSYIGVKLTIDEFCSESSFIYLLNFPIDDIKIEKSYVTNMTKDANKVKIVNAIIKLTEVLKLGTVADGIIDEDTQKQLKKMGCSYGQGFPFSHAVDVSQFEVLLPKKSEKQ